MEINDFARSLNDYIDHLTARYEILIKQNRVDDAEAVAAEGEAFNKLINNCHDLLSVSFPENGIIEMIHSVV
jgi:hypothetical protein